MRVLDLRNEVDVEHGQEFLQGLGTYWTEKFEDSNVLATLVGATQDQFTQADVDLKEVVKVYLDVSTAPIYHLQLWFRITLLESQMTTDHPLIPAYSPGTGPYGNGLVYGQRVPQLWTFETSTDLVNPRCVTNGVANPTFVGLQNQAFYYRKGVIGFRFNPFNSEYFVVSPTEADRAVTVWLRCSDWDVNLVQNQYAIALGMSAPTSEDYALLVEGAWSSRIRGPSDRSLYKVISGATGVPLCKNSGEVVEQIETQGNSLIIVTSESVYKFPDSHTSTVSVGDTLSEGQAFTDALRVKNIADLKSGSEDVAVPPDMFAHDFGIKEPLIFPNQRVPVSDGGLDSDDNRIVKFPVYGLHEDIINYRKHSARVGLYRALDIRGLNANTVPTAAQLVPTINPVVDLLKKHVRPHMILLFGDNERWPAHPDVQRLLHKQLDLIVPPHARVIDQDLDLSVSVSSVSDSTVSASSRSRSESSITSKSSVSSASTSSASTSSSVSPSSVSSASSESNTSSSLSAVSASSVSLSSASTISTVTASSRSSRSLESSSTESVSSVSSMSSLTSPSTISTRSSGSSATADISTASTSSNSSSSTLAESSQSSSSSLSTRAARSTSSYTLTFSSLSESSGSESSYTLTDQTSSSSSSKIVSDSSNSGSSHSEQTASSASSRSVSSISSRSLSSQTWSTVTGSSVSMSSPSLSSRSSRTDSSNSSSSNSSSTPQTLSSFTPVTSVSESG